MDILPTYLKELAHNCERKKNTVTFLLKCTCGNESFEVKKGKTNYDKESEERWKNYWRKYRFLPIFSFTLTVDRKSGKRYWYGGTLFGIRVGRYYVEDLHMVKDISIMKIKCPCCGKEHIIFDNRKHGYDALTDLVELQEGRTVIPFADESDLKFRRLCKSKPCAIRVTVQNDLPTEDFYDTFGSDASEEVYSHAFSWIAISSVIDGKTRTIFDMETS